jgi:hypothetical protein
MLSIELEPVIKCMHISAHIDKCVRFITRDFLNYKQQSLGMNALSMQTHCDALHLVLSIVQIFTITHEHHFLFPLFS